MDKCSQKFHTDQSEKGFFVCSLCECSLGIHCAFIHCPLLENEVICVDCCHNEVSKDTAIEKFKKAGLDYTRKEIDAACRDCGSRPVPEESNGHTEQGT